MDYESEFISAEKGTHRWQHIHELELKDTGWTHIWASRPLIHRSNQTYQMFSKATRHQLVRTHNKMHHIIQVRDWTIIRLQDLIKSEYYMYYTSQILQKFQRREGEREIAAARLRREQQQREVEREREIQQKVLKKEKQQAESEGEERKQRRGESSSKIEERGAARTWGWGAEAVLGIEEEDSSNSYEKTHPTMRENYQSVLLTSRLKQPHFYCHLLVGKYSYLSCVNMYMLALNEKNGYEQACAAIQ